MAVNRTRLSRIDPLYVLGVALQTNRSIAGSSTYCHTLIYLHFFPFGQDRLGSVPFSRITTARICLEEHDREGAYMSQAWLRSLTLYQYADLLLKLGGVLRHTQLSVEMLRDIQRRRFQRLLCHVFDHSPFYRWWYREHGITRQDLPGVQLHDLPTIDKQIMMANFDDLICERSLKKSKLEEFVSDPSTHGQLYRGIYQVLHTSGSTGHIGLFVYDIHSWNITKALAMTRVSRSKINPFKKNRLAYLGATNHYAGISLVADAPRLFYDLLFLSIGRPMEELAPKLQSFQPTALSGYASSIHLLAEAQLKSRLNIFPERIICSGDQLTDSMRETIYEAFRVQPINFYAASESLCMAAECHLHRGLHLFEDWHIYELVDENLEPVPDGQPGSLVITTLHNDTQPLIRYRMFDEMILEPKPCDCGSNFKRIERILGRGEEFLWFTLPDGKREFLHPSLIIEFFVPGLEKFQLIQKEPNHLHMKMVLEGSYETSRALAESKLRSILMEKKLHQLVNVSTEVVDNIPLDEKSAKARLIIPYREKAN